MAASKQCSKCSEGYDYDLKACPGCGYQGYKILEVDHASAVAVQPVMPPQAVPTPTGVPASVETAQLQPQRIIAWLVAAAVIVSLFMVWAQASVAAASYVRLCKILMQNLDEAANTGGLRVLLLFLPGIAALKICHGAFRINGDQTVRAGFTDMLVWGVVGCLASWQTYDYVSRSGGGLLDLTGALGPGFQLFWVSAVAGGALGLWGLITTPEGQYQSASALVEDGTSGVPSEEQEQAAGWIHDLAAAEHDDSQPVSPVARSFARVLLAVLGLVILVFAAAALKSM